ncbi:MAG: hypothetical protein ACE5IG_00210 [Dehalococcoidia bacterium]
MQQSSRFGIYLNLQRGEAVRINSPYWFPQGPDWVYLTPEVNATLLQIRELAKAKGLVPNPEAITWGSIPLRDA